MFRIDRICVMIFIFGFALLLLSFKIVAVVDEIIVYSLLGCALSDCIWNRAWRKYKPLLIFLTVMGFYLGYSLLAVHYNTSSSVLFGLILEVKPFIPILVFMCIAPEFTPTELKICRGIAIFNALVLIISLPLMNLMRSIIFGHDACFGGTALTTAIVYLFASADKEIGFTKKGLIFFFIVMVIGLASARSKFYGEFIIAFALLLFYRQQMTRHLSGSQIVLFSGIGLLVFLAAYDKINFYFLSGIDLSTFDLTKMDEFARLALYGMAPDVLALNPIFGTGLASYASFASSSPGYSQIYYEFKLDKVYGLTPDNPKFISDAYYPSLVQYGIVGIILFIYFWVWVYNQMRPLTRIVSRYNRALFLIGIIILISYFIEMTSGTLVFMAPGELLACILGTVCAAGRTLRQEKVSDNIPSEEPLNNESHPGQRIMCTPTLLAGTTVK